MEEKAIEMVTNYVINNLNKFERIDYIKVVVIWKCKILKNWRYLISTSTPDNRYYEVIYDGVNYTWQINVYEKIDRLVVKESLDEIREYFTIND